MARLLERSRGDDSPQPDPTPEDIIRWEGEGGRRAMLPLRRQAGLRIRI